MSGVLKISRFIPSTAAIALLALMSVVYGHSQSGRPSAPPAESTPKSTLSNIETDKASKADPKPELTPPATPEEIRQAQIEADTKKLYQLSAELRAEVAKTYKESLSLTVLKKAQEVEKLAKSLKAELNQEAAAAKHH